MTPRSILIVDDEANQRLMVEQALRALAFDWVISTAASGQEALEALALRPPDLIITDYHMPIMNGLELIARVRERHIPSRIRRPILHVLPHVFHQIRRHANIHRSVSPACQHVHAELLFHG